LLHKDQATVVLNAQYDDSSSSAEEMIWGHTLSNWSQVMTEHYPAEISGTWYRFGRNRISSTFRVLICGKVFIASLIRCR